MDYVSRELELVKTKLLLIIYRLSVFVLFWLAVAVIIKTLSYVRNTLTIFIGGIFLTFTLEPLVQFVESKLKLSRLISIIIVFSIAGIILAVICLFLVPTIVNQIMDLWKKLPDLMKTSLNNLIGVLVIIVRGFKCWLPENIELGITEIVASIQNAFINNTLKLLQNLPLFTFNFLRNTVLILLDTVAVLVISFYLLKDKGQVISSLYRYLKPFPEAEYYLKGIVSTLSGFIRGQLLAGLYVWALVALSLAVVGIEYAAAVGVVAGILELVPFFGAFAGFLLATLLAFSKGWTSGLITAIVLIIGYQLLAKLIYPYIMGRVLKLSPVTVLLAVLCGAEIGGVLGMLVAVPITAIVKHSIDIWMDRKARTRRKANAPQTES